MCSMCNRSGSVGFINLEEHAVENVTHVLVSEGN